MIRQTMWEISLTKSFAEYNLHWKDYNNTEILGGIVLICKEKLFYGLTLTGCFYKLQVFSCRFS